MESCHNLLKDKPVHYTHKTERRCYAAMGPAATLKSSPVTASGSLPVHPLSKRASFAPPWSYRQGLQSTPREEHTHWAEPPQYNWLLDLIPTHLNVIRRPQKWLKGKRWKLEKWSC